MPFVLYLFYKDFLSVFSEQERLVYNLLSKYHNEILVNQYTGRVRPPVTNE